MIRRSTERLLWITTIALVLCLAFGRFVIYRVKAEADTYENIHLFNTVLSLIKAEYVDKEDSQTLIYGAIDGMLKTLDDPYTRFMPPKQFKEMKVETTGKFGGLGIYIDIRDEQLTVVSPIPDTPAYKAGVKAWDAIVKIEGKSTKGMIVDDAVNKLRGDPGTKVTVTVIHKGTTTPVDIVMTREIIKIKNVDSQYITNSDIGYVRIKQFQEDTGSDLEKVLKDFEKHKPKGLILDLRNNPGGLLIAAYKVADMFLTDGLIVYTKGRVKEQDQEFNADSVDYCHNVPMIVLVNGGSASASEIVTGALKDHKRALIVGEKTFGKGIVQTVKELAPNTALSYTTAKYYTPAGICIQKIGIEPNIEVKTPEPATNELRVIRGILEGKYVENFLKTAGTNTGPDAIEKLRTDLKAKNLDLDPFWLTRLVRLEKVRDKSDFEIDLDLDTQLKRAFDILKAGKTLKGNI
jgi:carboxyl-terminal processing protease